MKIAYLVLAHHEPRLFSRLIQALVSNASRVFVHLDARAQLSDFQVSQNQVAFLKKRVRVNRGGWSLTAAMILALREAYLHSDCDYFIFLAGTDYPIKSNDYIESFLADRFPTNFVNFYPLLHGSYGVANLTRYHFVDELCGAARAGITLPTRIVERLTDALPARVFPRGSVPFRGSDRWCLNRSTVQLILECLRSPVGRAYTRYFRHTWGSDEMLFQTIIFNSNHAAQCHLYDRDTVRAMVEGRLAPWPDEAKAYLHYIDWDVAREDPAILDERDLPMLETTDALFACKFLEEQSTGLLDQVDQRLRGASTTAHSAVDTR